MFACRNVSTQAQFIQEHHLLPATGGKVFVPMSGSSVFVKFLYSAGHHVSALDLVPEALAELQARLETSFKEPVPVSSQPGAPVATVKDPR